MRTFGENSLLRKIKWHKNPFVSRASPLHTTTEKFIHLKNGQWEPTLCQGLCLEEKDKVPDPMKRQRWANKKIKINTN